MNTGQSPTQNKPRRIGVTGGIGSGKTTVCREFERLGRRVIYADPLAREVMERDGALRRAIQDAFGREAYQTDGKLNRRFLAGEMFSSETYRKRMNAIVHPFVFQAIDEIIEKELAKPSEPYVLIEAALVYESGLDRTLDAVLFVDAPVDVRVARVARRDGLSDREILQRITSQKPAHILRKRADFVLLNIGDIAQIRPKIAFLDRIFMRI